MIEVLAALLAVAGGLAGGLLGVGGGILFVPAMAIFLDFGQVRAESTSLLVIVIVAGVGAYRQYGYGNVRLREAALIGVLSPPGVLAGVVIANAVPERALKLAFAALALVFAVQLTRRALNTPTSGSEGGERSSSHQPAAGDPVGRGGVAREPLLGPRGPARQRHRFADRGGVRRRGLGQPLRSPSGPGSCSATGGGSLRSPRTPAARPATASSRWSGCERSSVRPWRPRSRGTRPGRRGPHGSGAASRSGERRPVSGSAAARTPATIRARPPLRFQAVLERALDAGVQGVEAVQRDSLGRGKGADSQGLGAVMAEHAGEQRGPALLGQPGRGGADDLRADLKMAEQPPLLADPDLGPVGELARLADVVEERGGHQQVGVEPRVQHRRARRRASRPRPCARAGRPGRRDDRPGVQGARRNAAAAGPESSTESTTSRRPGSWTSRVRCSRKPFELLDGRDRRRAGTRPGRTLPRLEPAHVLELGRELGRGSARPARAPRPRRRARSGPRLSRPRGISAPGSCRCGRAARAPGRESRCARAAGPCGRTHSGRRTRRPGAARRSQRRPDSCGTERRLPSLRSCLAGADATGAPASARSARLRRWIRWSGNAIRRSCGPPSWCARSRGWNDAASAATHRARGDRRLARRGARRPDRPRGILRLPGEPADDHG